MKNQNIEEQRYLKAKKRVKSIKEFYSHLIVYILGNIFITSSALYDLIKDDGNSFLEAISNINVYSVWFFWGIGLFFHWLSIFGFKNLTSKKWEEQKIKELMAKDLQDGK